MAVTLFLYCGSLISTDALTRGMDLPGVACVVNYDAPFHMKTYVHRVGRTARAGQAGVAYTLLTAPEVRPFKDMLRKAERRGSVKRVSPKMEEAFAPLRVEYQVRARL